MLHFLPCSPWLRRVGYTLTGPVHELVKTCPGCRKQNLAVAFDCVSCGFVLDNVDPAVPVDIADAVSDSGKADIPPDAPAKNDQLLICPKPDCGQANPAGSVTCLYCNQVLPRLNECKSACELVIEWPWGIETIEGKMVIGREAPAAPDLAARLESQYRNVSRQHGYLLRRQDALVLCDLGSVNGSFVNEVRIEAHQEIILKTGDRIRFASHLVATVRKAD